MTPEELDEIKQTIKSAIEETKKVTSTDEALKAQYQQYYKDKDAQLSKFWESSKYVWTFLAVVFGGYGVVLMNSFDESMAKQADCFNLILCGICLVGIILSVVWIFIERGNKAWCEVFELAIWSMENSFKESASKDQRYVKGKDEDLNELNQKRKYNIDNYIGNVKRKFPFGAGFYSPSKINIVLGWILVLIWSFLFWAHYSQKDFFDCESLECHPIDVHPLIIIVIIICVSYLCIRLVAKSSAFTKNNHYQDKDNSTNAEKKSETSA